MRGAVNTSVSELSHHLQQRLGDDPAFLLVRKAMRDPKFANELASLVDLSPASLEEGGISGRAIADVCFAIAKRSAAIELCRTALDWCSVHTGALLLFEELADESLLDELCARYQVFLEDAPLHGIAAQTCATVLAKMMRVQEQTAHWDLQEVVSEEGCWEERRNPRLLQEMLMLVDPQNAPPRFSSSD